MRGITALLLACFLSGPLYPQAAGAPVQTVGSLAKRTCGANAAPLPQARLVKDVLAAMPDKCDERLFGTWYCGIMCYRDDCRASGGEHTLRRSVDPDGYERIHRRVVLSDGDVVLSEYRVERKWSPAVSNNPLEKGKLANNSCNGRTRDGQGTFTINIKAPDGSGRYQWIYGMNPNGRFMRLWFYSVRWVDGKPHKKLLSEDKCRRELKQPSP